MDQQTGQYRMYTCKDCGAAFSAPYREKAHGAAVPSLCPECRKARTRENNRQCKARQRVRSAHKAMLARLAARDAAYAAHPHGAVTVSVRADGRRVITRGIVCGTGVSGGSKLVEPVPSTGYLHPAPSKAAGKDGSAGKREEDASL